MRPRVARPQPKSSPRNSRIYAPDRNAESAWRRPRPWCWCKRRHREDPVVMLGANRFYGIHLLDVAHRVGGAAADFGENVGAHIAAGLGPFVVLLHEHGADQA